MPIEIRSIGPIERVMYLRTLPLFGTLPTTVLAEIAEWTRERDFAEGDKLLEEGTPVESLHILLRGSAGVSRGDQVFRIFSRRDSVGVIGLLSGADDGVEAVALEECATLELRRLPLIQMFEDRFEVWHHVLREVAILLNNERRATALTEASAQSEGLSGLIGAMDVIDRMSHIGAAMRFTCEHPLAQARLAQGATLRSVSAGELICMSGSMVDEIAIPVSGRLSAGSPDLAGGLDTRGGALGLFQLFAEQSHQLDVVADEPSTTLVIAREALFDVFEDNPKLALDCLAELATDLLDAFIQHARAELDIPRGLAADLEPSNVASSEVWLRA